MINYKNLILEALKSKDVFDKFVILHETFLERLKNNCASYTKIKDNFDQTKLKDKWYREYHFECAENNTIILQLINERKSKTDFDYGKWTIKCLCDVKLGELVFNDEITRAFVEIVSNSNGADVLEKLDQLCTQYSHTPEVLANDQSFDQMLNTLKTNLQANVDNQSITFKVDYVTISLFDNTTHWELRASFEPIEVGSIQLNENTSSDIEDCVAKIAFNMPQQLLARLVEKSKNAKPDYISKNDK